MLECVYENDPRYVISVVQRKKQIKPASNLKGCNFKPTIGGERSTQNLTSARRTLTNIEKVCEILESHEERVLHYFNNRNNIASPNPLTTIKTDLVSLVKLLLNII